MTSISEKTVEQKNECITKWAYPHINWTETKFSYHLDWSLLMQVVEKIEAADYDDNGWTYCFTIERSYCVISEHGEAPIVEVGYEDSKILAVHEAVYQFCEWASKQEKV